MAKKKIEAENDSDHEHDEMASELIRKTHEIKSIMLGTLNGVERCGRYTSPTLILGAAQSVLHELCAQYLQRASRSEFSQSYENAKDAVIGLVRILEIGINETIMEIEITRTPPDGERRH